MAFNLQTFKTRTLTSIVFAVVMVTGLLWNQWSFIILFTIIHFGCWWEFVKLAKKINPQNFPYHLPLGLLYITLPCFLMINLRAFSFNYDSNALKIIPCMIIFSIWINDTMAYIVGSLMGKTPFSKISPKKTWEGTIGGALLAILVIGFAGQTISFDSLQSPKPGFHTIIKNYNFFIIAAICAIFGILGDLLESKLKRMANVKDSGSIMPGHGGFLDRFDSLLVATPFVWLYVYFFV